MSLDQFRALLQGRGGTLQGGMDAGGAPFELKPYGQKGGWDASFLVGYREAKPCPACGTVV